MPEMQSLSNCIKCPLSKNITLLFQLLSGAKAFAYYCEVRAVQRVDMTVFEEGKAKIKDN